MPDVDLDSVKSRLEKAGIRDVDSIPVGTLAALAGLSAEELNALAAAQKAAGGGPKLTGGFGGTIF